MTSPVRFQTWLNGGCQGSKATLQAAQNLADRPYRPGYAEVIDMKTGAVWRRVEGSWFSSPPPAPREDTAENETERTRR